MIRTVIEGSLKAWRGLVIDWWRVLLRTRTAPENTTELEERASGWASFRQQGMKGKRKGVSVVKGAGKTSRTTTQGSEHATGSGVKGKQAVRHSVYGLHSEHSRQHRQSENRDTPSLVEPPPAAPPEDEHHLTV